MPQKWTATRLKDVRALVNIESSFYKLVGGRRLGFLDPAFLRLVAHIGLGQLQTSGVQAYCRGKNEAHCGRRRFLTCCFPKIVTFRNAVAGTILHKLMPFYFKPAALSQLGSAMPYSKIESNINRDAAISLVAFLIGIAAVILKVMRLW